MVLEYAHQHLPEQIITQSCRFAYTSTMVRPWVLAGCIPGGWASEILHLRWSKTRENLYIGMFTTYSLVQDFADFAWKMLTCCGIHQQCCDM
jgi:hypothetical protein